MTNSELIDFLKSKRADLVREHERDLQAFDGTIRRLEEREKPAAVSPEPLIVSRSAPVVSDKPASVPPQAVPPAPRIALELTPPKGPPRGPRPDNRPKTKTDALVQALRDAGKPMSARELNAITKIGPDATPSFLAQGEKVGIFKRCGTRPNQSGRPSILWKLATVTVTDPEPAPAAAAPPAPKPRPKLGTPDPEQFPKAPRKGQVWQGSGQTRIVSSVVFNPESPSSYLVNYTQVPGSAVISSYRTSWETWAEAARCIKEPAC